MTTLIDARFAGGPIQVDTERSVFDDRQLVRVALPGCSVNLFPHEARALAAALTHAAENAPDGSGRQRESAVP